MSVRITMGHLPWSFLREPSTTIIFISWLITFWLILFAPNWKNSCSFWKRTLKIKTSVYMTFQGTYHCSLIEIDCQICRADSQNDKMARRNFRLHCWHSLMPQHPVTRALVHFYLSIALRISPPILPALIEVPAWLKKGFYWRVNQSINQYRIRLIKPKVQSCSSTYKR